MNQLSVYQPKENQNPTCTELLMMAERELAAFFTAVTQRFGSSQARLSAEDWLQELGASNGLPASTRDWRRITVKVAARLAIRMREPRTQQLFTAELAAAQE